MSENRIPIKVITLSDEVEECLRKNLIKDDNGTRLELNTHLTLKLMEQIDQKEEYLQSTAQKSIPIICRPDLRLYFRRFIERKYPRIQVISYMEVPPNYKLDIIDTIHF